MSNYSRADDRAQWFQDDFPGASMDPNVVVLHTTEGTTWPGYGGGATAPNYTALPDFKAKRLVWRAHYPDERSARALRNTAGGVETNTLNAVQVELIGTCDPPTHKRWGRTPHIYWPEAPEWALRDLAAFLADMHKRHGVKLEAPRFLAYPASFGDSPVRFSFAQWRNFYGVCGHQHVPENSHGDPGALNIARVLELARGFAKPKPAPKPVKPAKPAKPKPAPKPAKSGEPTRIENAHKLGEQLIRVLNRAIRGGRRGAVLEARNTIRKGLRKQLPPK